MCQRSQPDVAVRPGIITRQSLRRKVTYRAKLGLFYISVAAGDRETLSTEAVLYRLLGYALVQRRRLFTARKSE
jgi:hypothetical protein